MLPPTVSRASFDIDNRSRLPKKQETLILLELRPGCPILHFLLQLLRLRYHQTNHKLSQRFGFNSVWPLTLFEFVARLTYFVIAICASLPFSSRHLACEDLVL